MSRMLFRLTSRAPRTAAAVIILMGLASGSAAAQSHAAAVTAIGGWSTPGDLSPGMDSSTVLASGWTAGLQFEAWEGSGWYGLRTSGSYATRGDELGNEYRILSADVGVGVRLLQPDPARIVVPYMVFGLGGIRYSGRDGDAPLAGGIFGNGATTRAVATAALGLDILSAGQFALRLEAADQMVLLSLGDSPAYDGFPTAHNLHVYTGIQMRFGEQRRRVVEPPPGPRTLPPSLRRPAGPGAAHPQSDSREEPSRSPRSATGTSGT